MTDPLSRLGLRLTVGLQRDCECLIMPLTLPRRSQFARYAESISNIDLVKYRLVTSRVMKFRLNSELHRSSQDGGPSDER